MKPTKRSVRRCRKPSALGAVGRAALLAVPLGAALVLGLSPRSERDVMAYGADGIDTMSTGSVSPSRFAFSFQRGGSNEGCLRFPDGSQRGSC